MSIKIPHPNLKVVNAQTNQSIAWQLSPIFSDDLKEVTNNYKMIFEMLVPETSYEIHPTPEMPKTCIVSKIFTNTMVSNEHTPFEIFPLSKLGIGGDQARIDAQGISLVFDMKKGTMGTMTSSPTDQIYTITEPLGNVRGFFWRQTKIVAVQGPLSVTLCIKYGSRLCHHIRAETK